MTVAASSRIELRSSNALLRFDKSADRFDHRLLFRFDQDWVLLLNSDLHDPNAPWPSDPPIQQLVVEPIGSTAHRDVALGVGMCGHGHWSLAAQWVQLQSSDQVALEMDYACKQQPPVQIRVHVVQTRSYRPWDFSLGSRYSRDRLFSDFQ